MEETGLSRQEAIAKIEKDRPRGYPDHAPTQTHRSVWDGLEVTDAMNQCLASSPSHELYESRLNNLRRTLSQRLNPALRGYDPTIDELLCPFDSDGGYPSIPGRAVLIRRVQDKISDDLAQLPRTAKNRRRIQWLCLTGSLMFASAAEGALEKLRLVMRDQLPAGQLTQAIGRAVSSPQDIELALEFLFRGLEQRSQAVPQWKGAMNHLRACPSES